MSLVRCTRCLTPTTKPGLLFDDRGICQACLNYDKRETIDWDARYEALLNLCSSVDSCIIPVSGGKDSHFLTSVMMDRVPEILLVNVTDHFTKTEAGKHNLANLQQAFGPSLLTWSMSPDTFAKATCLTFEKDGEPLRYIENCIYTVPVGLAGTLGYGLVMYGENSAYEYGSVADEGTAIEWANLAGLYARSFGSPKKKAAWRELGLSSLEVQALSTGWAPLAAYMSSYVPWDGEEHYRIAQRYGFQDLDGEWAREGNIECYDQIDSLGYIVHLWLKYPKFGYARATDIASRWVRKGKISRQEGLRLVEEHDHRLDRRALDDFCYTLGYSIEQFWTITERFWNRDIFEKVRGEWQFRD